MQLLKKTSYYFFFILIPSLAISATTISFSEIIKKPLDEVKQLIQTRGIKINQKDDNHETILMHASKNGKKEIVEYLINTYKEKISNYSLNHALAKNWKENNDFKKFQDIFGYLIEEVFLRNSTNRELTEFAKALIAFARDDANYHDTIKEFNIYENFLQEDQSQINSQKPNKGQSQLLKYTVVKFVQCIVRQWGFDFKQISTLIAKEHLKKNQYYTFFIEHLVKKFYIYSEEEYLNTNPAEQLLSYLIKLGDIKVGSQEAKKIFLDICGSDNEHEELLSLLLERGIPVTTIKDEWGQNGVMLAASFGKRNRISLIMKKVKDPKEQAKFINAQDKKGMTALMLACEAQQLNTVKLLVEQYGADLNLVNENKQTALMIVAGRVNRDHPDVPGLFSEAEDLEIVQYLIKAKANTSMVNGSGYTAYTLAQKVQAQSIVDFLAQKTSHDSNLENASQISSSSDHHSHELLSNQHNNSNLENASQITSSNDHHNHELLSNQHNNSNLENASQISSSSDHHNHELLSNQHNNSNLENASQISQVASNNYVNHNKKVNKTPKIDTNHEEETNPQKPISKTMIALITAAILGGISVIFGIGYWIYKKYQKSKH